MPRTRRCSFCRRTGHDRRNCQSLRTRQQRQRHRQQQPQQQSLLHCVLCQSNTHDSYDCPIISEDTILFTPPPSPIQYYMQYHVRSHNSYTSPSTQPQQVHQQQHPKIYWDQCGKCGLQNNGGICDCGEKQVVPVPCKENGMYECTVCYTDLKILNKVTTKCGHHYCIDCFLGHYTSNNPSAKNCPMCRATLLEV